MSERFEPTGEFRPPLGGEYFRRQDGSVAQAAYDFTRVRGEIMRRIEVLTADQRELARLRNENAALRSRLAEAEQKVTGADDAAARNAEGA
jgi:hypothetical protein